MFAKIFDKGIVKKLVKKEKPVKAFEDKERLYSRMRLKNIIEITVLMIFIFILLVLLCNRTFFRNEYKTSKIQINIPMLMFYVDDTGDLLTLKTLRKSQYVKDFFDEELENMTRYNCDGGFNFYYNNDSNTAIYSLNVVKDFAVKTVKIRYANGDADCLCNAKKILNAKEASQLCSVK